MHPAAPRGAHDERAGEVAIGPVADARRLGDQLVERRVDEVGELDLGDGEQAVHRHPDRHPDDRGLGERRVDDACLAELLEETGRRAEDAATRADVLAQHQHAIVGLHGVPERVVDRLHDVLLGHRASPWRPMVSPDAAKT